MSTINIDTFLGQELFSDMSTIDIIKDTDPIMERELFSDIFPTIEEAWYFTDMIRLGIAV